MITKNDALVLRQGQVLYHVKHKNRDGSAMRARVNGRTVVWKTRPNDFKVPMKHGLKHCFYLTPSNAAEWLLEEPAEHNVTPPTKAEGEFDSMMHIKQGGC